MMTGTITDDQARALSHLVTLLRPGWDVSGIRAALSKARHHADASELAIAAIRACQDPANRTPAVIALDGPHWRTGGGALTRDLPAVKCDEHGLPQPCRSCAADDKAQDAAGTHPGSTPPRSLDRERAYEVGPALARQALEAAKGGAS